jgi:hypothetical protein
LPAYINDHSAYTVELLQLQWRFGDPLDLYVMKPKTVARPAVILYLYGFPADTERFQDENFQRAVTKDGLAAVGFVSALTGHRYHDRPMREWFISELQESFAASAHDIQMILNYLQTRGDLDMSRVGMYAQGSGASIAILASAVDPRIGLYSIAPASESGNQAFCDTYPVSHPVEWRAQGLTACRPAQRYCIDF